MGLLADIQELINEHGSSSILRERLSLIKDQLALLQEENADLIKKVSSLQKEKQLLQDEVKELTRDQQFIECRGAFFKRKPTGGFNRTVYCPLCQSPLASLENELPYYCHRCQIALDFNGRDLDQVMVELAKENS